MTNSVNQTIVCEMTSKTRCTNCKCWRDPQDFIGAKGVPVKRCVKCREKDARQKQRPEVREKRNERQNIKRYDIVWREKKRNEDEEAFLAHNAAKAREWRNKNKEHCAKYNRNNIKHRITTIKSQASIKGIPWMDNMTFEVCAQMVSSPCYYCNVEVIDGLHGIDRMDNTKGYTTDNCVGCCKKCNFIKKSLDAHTFIKRCMHIACVHGGEGSEYPEVWRDSKSVSYKSYKERAFKKQLDFHLSEDNFYDLTHSMCGYCYKKSGVRHLNGIDRKDNNKGYTADNVITCCAECNQMKSDLEHDEFILHCKKVASYILQHPLELPVMEQCLSVIAKRTHKV